MDEYLTLAVIILGFALIVVGGVIIFEYLETPLDKCQDSCMLIKTEEPEIRQDCLNRCLEKFVECAALTEGDLE